MGRADKITPDPRPHRRYNPLMKEWVLVSTNRINRPWKGQQETVKQKKQDSEANNPLKPGGIRANNIQNPDYKDVFLFPNDFPALVDCEDFTEKTSGSDDLLVSETVSGSCDVMCFHPDSSTTLARMTRQEIEKVIAKWQQISAEKSEKYKWMQIFENKGEAMGCSNPHPHCQIWCSNFLPNVAEKELLSQKSFFAGKSRPLLSKYLDIELAQMDRVVIQNDSWVYLVPYWATWPFELMLLPKRHVSYLHDLEEKETRDLAELMRRMMIKYDNLFGCDFPYSMGWHGAPFRGDPGEYSLYWTLHAHYYPPLLRSATVKKFMVGFEMLSMPQRDLTAEKAAEILRSLPEVHYEDN